MTKIICKYCKQIVVEDNAEKVIEEELNLGNRYMQCPNCYGLMWIKDLKWKKKEYRTVTEVLEELAKAQKVIDKLWFELWRMFKKKRNNTLK